MPVLSPNMMQNSFLLIKDQIGFFAILLKICMFNFQKKVLIFSHLFAAIWESETKSHKIHLYALF